MLQPTLFCSSMFPDPQNCAESLINLARSVSLYRDLVLEASDMPEYAFARIVLAQRFVKMPLSFQLRAMVEDWDQLRIVRELY